MKTMSRRILLRGSTALAIASVLPSTPPPRESLAVLARGGAIVSARTTTAFQQTEYLTQLMRSIASAVGVPYETLTTDFKSASFSAARLTILNNFRR